jgi:hypothetical protein
MGWGKISDIVINGDVSSQVIFLQGFMEVIMEIQNIKMQQPKMAILLILVYFKR